MPSSKSTYDLPPGAPSPVVKEEHIEYGFIGKLQNLKYEYRDDNFSQEQIETRTGELCLQFDQDRKRQEAFQADQQDETDLRALENTLKRWPKS